MITNPLGPGNDIAGPGNIEDHIPTGPAYKLLGLAFAIPSTLLIGTEGICSCKSPHYCRGFAEYISRDHAFDGGSSGPYSSLG